MFDCAGDVVAHHDERVTLPQAERTEMRDRRNANRERLKKGLANKKKPTPREFRTDHPGFAAGMSLEAFRAAARAMADATGMSHAVMEHQLARHGIHSTPKLRVPHFMVLPLVIAKSDLLVVMPRRLAETFSSLVPLKVMQPPVSLPEFDIGVYWHERFHDDPANRWFRRAFVKLFRR